ncbi:MAG: hypothetical protein OQJ97_10225 [Rhodospirillales bacterium]|nr:hypothetical protein [Rhodospirillales bacterium]
MTAKPQDSEYKNEKTRIEAEKRKEREAEALRANLRSRKTAVRKRETEDKN